MTLNITQSLFPSSDGTLIYAEAYGNPHLPAIVLLHGFALSALVWAQIVRDTRLLEFFYLVAYDMRGHGRSGKPEALAGHTSQLYAADFAAVSKGFGLHSPIFLGWSLGGLCIPFIIPPVAAILKFKPCIASNAADITAHLEPNAISAIVWVSPMPYLAPETFATVPKQVVLDLLASVTNQDNVTLGLESRNAFGDTLFNDPSSIPVEIKWSWVGSSTQQKPEVLATVTSRVQDPTGLFAAGARGLPLLIISGGQDQQLNAEPVWEIAKAHFKDLTIHNIPRGSHALFYDFEDEFVQELLGFSKRVFGIGEK